MDSEKPSMKSSNGSRMTQVLTCSTLLLTILLACTVSTLIYIQTSSYFNLREEKSESPDVTASVHYVNKDRNQVINEDVSYTRSDNVAIYIGQNGSFDLQDYSKGIQITKLRYSGICGVYPRAFTAQDGYSLEAYLSDTQGQTIQTRSEYAEAHLVPGLIDDVSFIPSAAHQHCTHGYQWMVLTPASLDLALDNGHDIVKRGAKGCKTITIVEETTTTNSCGETTCTTTTTTITICSD